MTTRRKPRVTGRLCAFERCTKGRHGARKGIDHKRPNAKYCTPYCRVAAHNAAIAEAAKPPTAPRRPITITPRKVSNG